MIARYTLIMSVWKKNLKIPSDRRMLGRGWGKCESGKRIL